MALAASCGGSGAASPAEPWPSSTQPSKLPGGRIAFSRLDSGQMHGAIFTISPDASQERRLTNPAAGIVDDQPAWSPGGERIAFERCRKGHSCWVFTIAADGGRPRRVQARCTLKPVCELTSPAWTPDGKLLVSRVQGRKRTSRGHRQIEHSSLVQLNLNRRTQRTIIQRGNWSGDIATPTVSPNGRTIAYTRSDSRLRAPAHRSAILAINLDGSGHRRLSPGHAAAPTTRPSRPPAGSSFAATQSTTNKLSRFWTIRSNGTALTQLTHLNRTLARSASYSPDGQWIVYAHNADLFVMRIDSTANRPLTRTNHADRSPDWGPAAPYQR